MTSDNGFTLIELMIVIAIIAIIVVIAVPNLARSRMNSNEASAVGGMRTISTGQTGYQAAAFKDNDGDGVGDYGSLAELANPDGTGATPAFIDAILGNGQKHGYIYTVNVVLGTGNVSPAYTCTGVPTAPGKTGYRQFFVDESGVIRFTGDGSVVSASSPPLE